MCSLTTAHHDFYNIYFRMQRRPFPLLLLLLLVLDVARALLASPHGTAARLTAPEQGRPVARALRPRRTAGL